MPVKVSLQCFSLRRNWAFADSLELLCDSKDLALDVNGKRRTEVARLVEAAEQKNNFRLNLQLADNFFCRGVIKMLAHHKNMPS